LGVVVGALGVALGYPAADPIAGLAITLVILVVLRGAGLKVVHRIMDGTEESTIVVFEEVAASVPGVEHVTDVRARWAGHGLIAELSVDVDRSLTVEEGHAISERVEAELKAAIPSLRHATVHVDPHERHV
jgi:cation diffusion facilitator family transporter